MFKFVPADSIRLQTNEFVIRKIKETDFMDFLDYLGNTSEKTLQAFRESVDNNDTLLMIVKDKIAATFLLYQQDNPQLEEVEDEGICIGFTASQEYLELGLVEAGYGMIIHHLLENEVGFVAAKCRKNDAVSFKLMAKNQMTIFDEDSSFYYLIKMS